ncbi:tetraspanin-9-like [Cimex lectularius]|uniref:Tetraspanin n=1 Tax=Cimex lectularius TaxID=79782 RepID=A0A8I6RH80_CIMLE|nr:tetraspanin-9-like [Cimex lectularius]
MFEISKVCFPRFVRVWQFFSLWILAGLFCHGLITSHFSQSYREMRIFLDSSFTTDLPYIYFTLDISLFVVVMFGFCIICKLACNANLSNADNSKLFWLFVIIPIISMSYIALSLLCLYYRHTDSVKFQQEMVHAMVNYPDGKLANHLDWLQLNYTCCGINGSRDWIELSTYRNNKLIPISCCVHHSELLCTYHENKTLNSNETNGLMYRTNGCLITFKNTYRKEYFNLLLLGVIASVLCMIYSIGIRLIQTGERIFRAENKYKCWIIGWAPVTKFGYFPRKDIFSKWSFKDGNILSPELELSDDNIYPQVSQLEALKAVMQVREQYYKPDLIPFEKLTKI